MSRYGRPIIAPPWAFLPHEEVRGLWCRVDLSVVITPCPYPGCGARTNERCRFEALGTASGVMLPRSSTHKARRVAAKEKADALVLGLGAVVTLTKRKRQKKEKKRG